MRGIPIGWGGERRPLWFDGPATAQVPEGLRARVKTRGGPGVSARPAPTWGVRPSDRSLDGFEQYTSPSSNSERIRWETRQRCVQVDPADIVPTGVSFELVRTMVPSGAVGIMEKLPTVWPEAVALDEAGDPLFVYSGLNGSNPCLNMLVHPDPTVAPLRFGYRLLVQNVGDVMSDVGPFSGPVPRPFVGEDIVQPWEDMRYGIDGRWGDDQHVVVPGDVIVRYWITLFGPADRYAVTVGAQLTGYTQAGGRSSAALHSTRAR